MLRRFFLPIYIYFWCIGLYTAITSAAYTRFETSMAVLFPPYTVMVGICETGSNMIDTANYNASIHATDSAAFATKGVYPI